MASANTPVSAPLSAGANTAATLETSNFAGWQPNMLVITNRSAVEVFVTVDDSTPSTSGSNQYFLPAVTGAQVQIQINQPGQAEGNPGYKPNISAIGASAWSIWIQQGQ